MNVVIYDFCEFQMVCDSVWVIGFSFVLFFVKLCVVQCQGDCGLFVVVVVQKMKCQFCDEFMGGDVV